MNKVLEFLALNLRLFQNQNPPLMHTSLLGIFPLTLNDHTNMTKSGGNLGILFNVKRRPITYYVES